MKGRDGLLPSYTTEIEYDIRAWSWLALAPCSITQEGTAVEAVGQGDKRIVGSLTTLVSGGKMLEATLLPVRGSDAKAIQPAKFTSEDRGRNQAVRGRQRQRKTSHQASFGTKVSRTIELK